MAFKWIFSPLSWTASDIWIWLSCKLSCITKIQNIRWWAYRDHISKQNTICEFGVCLIHSNILLCWSEHKYLKRSTWTHISPYFNFVISPQNIFIAVSAWLVRIFPSGMLGAVSIRKTVLPGMAIPMLKIRRPNGRLIFNMEIAIRR